MYDPSLFSFSLLLHSGFAAPTPHLSYCIHPLVAAFCLPPFLGERLPFLSPLFEALSGRESQLVGPDFSRSRYLSGFITPGFLEKWRFGQGRA